MDCKTIYITSAEVSDNTLVLIPSRTIKNLSNTCNYGLVICCGVSASENLPVAIQVGDVFVPVLCKYGNELLANQFNRRVRYPIGYGDMNSNYKNGQFVILSCANLNARGTESTPTSL